MHSPHDRSIVLALDACAYFEVSEEESHTIVRDMARLINAEWRTALQSAGVTGGPARGYEPAFVHDEMKIALAI